jgi:hypothetical protein
MAVPPADSPWRICPAVPGGLVPRGAYFFIGVGRNIVFVLRECAHYLGGFETIIGGGQSVEVGEQRLGDHGELLARLHEKES